MLNNQRLNPTPLLLVIGVIAFAIAALSIADMFRARPYDGVVLRTDVGDRLVVREVVAGSGAAEAGLRPGDEIQGINRQRMIRPQQAAAVLNALRIGDVVPYLVDTADGIKVIDVRLSRRRIGGGSYAYACLLGFSFFLLGVFVLVRQPNLRASQVFFALCGLFLVFFVCRLRPPSYGQTDALILGIGTTAFLLLPAAFLHFCVIFPRPPWLLTTQSLRLVGHPVAWLWQRVWPLFYLLPAGVFLQYHLLRALGWIEPMAQADGVPLISWWLLALYLLAGLAALLDNARMLGSGPLRRGALLVFFGALLGLAPFVAAALAWTADGSLPAWALVTMPLLPLSFTYAIVRFQLLDIRIILRRSLVYTALTVLVTGAYAFSIAIFNALFSDSALGGTAAFPVLLALMIAFFFEPLRRRLQEVVDRNMFAERSRLRRAIANLGEALTAQPDAQRVVADLVDRLPDLLGLHFAALYRLERDLASDRGAIDDGDAALAGARWTRVAGPGHLPETLPVLPALHQHLQNRKQRLTHLDQLGGLWLHAPEVTGVVQQLDEYGVESLAELGSQRRALGLLLLSERRSQIAFEREEEALVQQLLDQTSVALETALLLEERTQRAELARELEIAAGIQRDLLPDELTFGDGWQVAAFCRPARDVGGDFVAQLPSPRAEAPAVVFGDVSGKSVSGALMMMAAHEALHALAMIDPEPTRMMGRANQRLYQLGKRSFVAVGYLRGEADGRLVYLLAGQPPLLRRQLSGAVEELPLPPHRIPLGALKQGRYDTLTAQLAPGEMVVACSDGVVEACAPDGSFFGLDRLRATLSGAPDDPQQAVDAVRAALEAFTRGARQYDDQTLVVVRRTGARWRGQRTGRVTLEAIDLRALALGGGSGDPSRADDGDGEAS